MIKIYSEKGGQIFLRYAMSSLNAWLWLLLILVLFTALFYYLGTKKYDSAELKQQMLDMEEMIKYASKRTKGTEGSKTPRAKKTEQEQKLFK